MSTPHLRPLAVAFGKARRLAGTNPNTHSNSNSNESSSTDSTEREV